MNFGELRRRAYDLLAPLEQQLRDFINKAMTEVLGFSWWDELGEDKIKDNVASVQSKSPEADLSYQPIEFTQFDHLVDIITGDLTHWKLGKALTPADLIDLLGSATSVSDLKAELEKRTTPRSIWDNVFARLFSDQEAWQAAKAALQKTVIRCRHKVMHHRPMRIHEVTQLKAACEQIEKTLSVKARTIQGAERTEIRETATELLDFAKSLNERLSKFQTINLPKIPVVNIPNLQIPTYVLPNFEIPIYPVPAGDLSAILARMPDTSTFDALNKAARASGSFLEYLSARDRINEQLGGLGRIAFPFFESVPDELQDEKDPPGDPKPGK